MKDNDENVRLSKIIEKLKLEKDTIDENCMDLKIELEAES